MNPIPRRQQNILKIQAPLKENFNINKLESDNPCPQLISAENDIKSQNKQQSELHKLKISRNSSFKSPTLNASIRPQTLQQEYIIQNFSKKSTRLSLSEDILEFAKTKKIKKDNDSISTLSEDDSNSNLINYDNFLQQMSTMPNKSQSNSLECISSAPLQPSSNSNLSSFQKVPSSSSQTSDIAISKATAIQIQHTTQQATHLSMLINQIQQLQMQYNMAQFVNKQQQNSEQHAQSAELNVGNKNRACNCKKTKCIKLYCECFANGIECGPHCHCTDCCNDDANKALRETAIQSILTRDAEAFNSKIHPSQKLHKKGCNCKKSNCLKKYCECYSAGVGCSADCKCDDCKNTSDSTNSINSNSQISNAQLLMNADLSNKMINEEEDVQENATKTSLIQQEEEKSNQQLSTQKQQNSFIVLEQEKKEQNSFDVINNGVMQVECQI